MKLLIKATVAQDSLKFRINDTLVRDFQGFFLMISLFKTSILNTAKVNKVNIAIRTRKTK
jgi:hypothetical protein